MEIQSSAVYIKNLRVRAFHGVMPQERRVGGDFVVSLRAEYPFAAALDSDDVADTLNYAAVAGLIREEMATPSALLEHAAGRIVRRLFAEYPAISRIDIDLRKANPPMGADSDGAGVELHLINIHYCPKKFPNRSN